MLRALSISLSLFLFLCLVASPANAQEQAPTLPFDRYAEPVGPPPPPPAEKKTEAYESYGWPMVIVDSAAFALLTASLVNHENRAASITMFAHSVGIYGLVPPIIHVLNAEPVRGLGSIGMRLGAPVLGALGAQIAAYVLVGAGDVFSGSHDADDIGAGPALVGSVLGALAAAAVDDFLLARRPIK